MGDDATTAVTAAAEAAFRASPSVAAAGDDAVDAALRGMAARLNSAAEPILAANHADVVRGEAQGMGVGLLDRLRLDENRLASAARQLEALADIPPEPVRRPIRGIDGDLVLEEWRRPVGVVGANFEARPLVVVDVASQLVKSHNAGVLRTGSAALESAIALIDLVVAPALADAGIDPDSVQLVRTPGRGSAAALVRQPELIPLVILRGSGDSTRQLATTAAQAGVRTLAHADGGAVVYVDASARQDVALDLLTRSLDRLGVCNRLNLLLVHEDLWERFVPDAVERLAAHTPPVDASLPPHDHPLGQEWALAEGREATVTFARVADADDAARTANRETSGLAAAVLAEDPAAASAFLAAYTGTGAFWNATTRLLDGFKLFSVPETGISIDRVPGPRGPVTFRDLYLRQVVVLPAARADQLT